MYYLYRHIRLGKNEPFYMGSGTIQDSKKYKEIYKRAYCKYNRNDHWINITKISEYTVDILYHSNSRIEICKKEIEFIKLYGRIDLKNGTLVNLTNGGDWDIEEHIFERDGHNNPAARKIIQYSLDGEFIKEWDCIICVSNFNTNKIRDCVRLNKNKNYKTDIYRTTQGFIWLYHIDNYNQKIEPKSFTNNSILRSKKVYKLDLENNIIDIYDGQYECAKIHNVNIQSLKRCIRSENKIMKNNKELNMYKFVREEYLVQEFGMDVLDSLIKIKLGK